MKAGDRVKTPDSKGAFVMLEELREIEWAATDCIRKYMRTCPACGGRKDEGGHEWDCWLSAKIKEADDGSD
jgi:hypothetical protein